MSTNIMANVQAITVKLEDSWKIDGKFLCSPKLSEEELPYTQFLADLNSHFSKKKTDYLSFNPQIGDYVAVHIAAGDENYELWYRAKIMQLYQRPGGPLAKLLLVDNGEDKFSPTQRMNKLPEKFVNYPHQWMSCILHDIVPVTMGVESDLKASVKKAKQWDSSALKYMQKLVKEFDMSVETKFVDENNVHHVVLYMNDNGVPVFNVNDQLVDQGYATLKTTDDLTLSQQPIYVKKNVEENRRSNPNGVPFVTPTQSLIEKREKAKERKREEYKQYAKKEKRSLKNDVSDLLGLLDDSNPTLSSAQASRPTDSSSDGSDMEKSPAPAMSNYKRIKPKLKPGPVIAEKLGQESADYLRSRLEGIELKPSKHVSFKEIVGDEASSISGYEGKRTPQNVPCNDSYESSEKELPISKNVGCNFILKAMCVDTSRQGEKKGTPKFSDDDVLVYGKRKRDPFKSVDQLNLPPFFKTCLPEVNLTNPSLFQRHMWSAMTAFRNVVGIADYGTATEMRVLAYLLPILCNMVQKEGDYATLGRGNGPFLIVCVSGWQEARDVYDICIKFVTYYRKNIRVDVRYGGMDDVAERNIRLLNGCDLFITTVPSLNYVLEFDFIKLDRLCHIVFDSADILVETFTDDIIKFMRTYHDKLKQYMKVSEGVMNYQIIAVGRKWSYGIHSLMKSYFLDEPLVIIANKIEAALFVKVPIVPEICNSSDRLDHLMAFLEAEAADENSVIFTNSAKGAEELHESLKTCSFMTSVITEYTESIDVKDTVKTWKASCLKSKGNALILSDNAIIKANIRNATCLIHYDYPQKKSHFGNRLSCLLDTIRENENKEKPKSLFCQIFITEKNNGVRYCTGLVKLLRRSGQKVPELLKSMANSSHELKEEQREFSEICPRLKLFGECRYIEDCLERHTIFKERDLLGLCPSTGFIKVVILDVISASSFWGRIVEHKLPYDPEGSAYDTMVYLKLQLEMQMFYSDAKNRTLCVNVAKYDVCVINTIDYGYQRVQIEKILEKEYERPKLLEVFGIDNGFTSKEVSNKLYICDEKFRVITRQAVEVIACCVKPVEQGDSWTDEASREIEGKARGKTLEGRVQFSLQNTIWVDPLVEKKMLNGIQTKAYSLDIGRDLINMGYGEKNLKHVEKLRQLLYDVQGHPIEVTGNKQNLPMSMIDHETAYLNDDDYEEVYVSSVEHPGLFFVQRVENANKVKALDNKIDATMSVKNTGNELVTTTFPVGYICVALFSGDQKWYRAQVVGISKDQLCYDIFFVDHGDREWIGKSKVDQCWPDILTEPFQAIECCFTNISPMDEEWTSKDGDALWDLCENKLLSAKVLSTSTSTHLTDTVRYAIELFDTTCNQTQNINHELVFMGVAKGSLQCLQEMFPHASISQSDKVIQNEYDKCPDLCVEIHQEQDLAVQVEKVKELKDIVLRAPKDGNVLNENGSIESLCKLLALSKKTEVQEILLSCFVDVIKNESYATSFEDNDGIKALCEILKITDSEKIKTYIVQLVDDTANDTWSLHVLQQMAYIDSLCHIIQHSDNTELLMNVLDSLSYFCKDNEANCAAVRHAEGLDSICDLYNTYTDMKVVERCSDTLKVVLANARNKEKIRELGCLQIIASLYNRDFNEATLKNVLQILILCIEDNEENREYLHKINAHQNLMKYSKSSKKLSMVTRMLLKELIQKLTPAPLTDFIITSDNTIDPGFGVYDDGLVDEQTIIEKKAPKTVWSQRRNLVTISICLRGVRSEETKVGPNTVHFRTVLNRVEYVLDIQLYENVREEDPMIAIKGGEVLITMWKVNAGQIWPRLLASEEKCPYIGVDFDRWVDEFPELEEIKVTDGTVLFQPDLPRPPPCTSYEGEQISVDQPGESSSSDDSTFSSDEDEDMVENRGSHPDYFNI